VFAPGARIAVFGPAVGVVGGEHRTWSARSAFHGRPPGHTSAEGIKEAACIPAPLARSPAWARQCNRPSASGGINA
jgi:hypothetical protein